MKGTCTNYFMQVPFYFKLWAHQDLNLGPPDYESGALTN